MSQALPGRDANELTSSDYWDDWWSRYVPDEFPNESERQYGRHGYFLRMMDSLGFEAGDSVIELGGVCSFRLLALAKWRSAQAVAVDYAVSSLSTTKRWFNENGCDVETIASNFYELPDRRFDFVTHWGVLEHEIDPEPLLQLSKRLLKPNGVLVFSMPNMVGPGAWIWKRVAPTNWALHIHHSDETIARALRRNGMSGKTFGYGPPAIYFGAWEKPTPRLRDTTLRLQSVLDRLGTSPALPYISGHRVFACRYSS